MHIKKGYTLTGKERDKETGYGYFGARYMDHELMSMWLSVDPMMEMSPNGEIGYLISKDL